MIAVDTNILIYAHREDSAWHDAAYACLMEVAQSRVPWAIAWPCLHEFLAIATHPRIYSPPTPRELALAQIEAWMESPSLVLIGETDLHWSYLKPLVDSGRIAGGQVHDALIAALCQQHGVSELWSADRDFSRFPGLAVRNPLI